LLDRKTIEKYDPTGMHKVYDHWPQIARESYQSLQDEAEFNEIDHVVFAGMGGSGTISDIFSSILSKTNIHVSVVKGYHLPSTLDGNSLLVGISVSGNTIETLSVLESAIKENCKIVCFSSGGKMESFCSKNKINFKKLKPFHSPRGSLLSFLYAMLGYFGSAFKINNSDVTKSITRLEELQVKINSSNLTPDNPSLNLAEWISGFPLVYYPWGLSAAAIRLKNSIQENGKTHAMAEDIIEASHNGIVSWERSSNVKPILIKGEDDYVKTKERWEIIQEFFKLKNIEFREVKSVKGSILSKLVNLIYQLDYTSIYKSFLLGIDPSPIEPIDFIKRRSSERGS
jgi:glucose/mannose-6-phosphate isomerase